MSTPPCRNTFARCCAAASESLPGQTVALLTVVALATTRSPGTRPTRANNCSTTRCSRSPRSATPAERAALSAQVRRKLATVRTWTRGVLADTLKHADIGPPPTDPDSAALAGSATW